MENRRSPQQARKAVSLTVKLAHRGIDEFVEKYATNISVGGLFIRTREPQPLGTVVHFKIEIANGQRMLQGTAVVKWIRGPTDPAGPAGMGLEFKELDEASHAVVKRILAGNAPAPAGAPPKIPAAMPSIAPLVPPASAPRPSKAVASIAPVGRAAPPTKPPNVPRASAPAPSIPPSVPRASAPAPSIPPSVPVASAPAPSIPPSVPLASAPAPSIPPAVRSKPIPPISPPVPPSAPNRVPPKPVGPPKPKIEPPEEIFEPFDPPLPEPVIRAPTPEEPPSAEDEGFDFDFPELDSSQAVDLDLDALIAQTPAPPAPLRREPAKAAFNVDVDLDLSAAATEPPPPPSEDDLADLPAATRHPLKHPPGAPAPSTRAPAGALVFLKPPATIDATGPVVGIDLGTSNTCCAVLVNGKPQMPRSAEGYSLIPSIVALSRQGALLVGNRAKSQLMLNPSQSIYGAKRLVGRDFDSETVQQVRERFHYEIVAGPDGKAAVKLGKHVLSLEEVQGIILQECRQMAERHLGTPVSRAVITCPAYYSEQQREAVWWAAAMAGLKVERMLNEPTAAALAYGLNRGLAKKVLVYDLGGGTFDATILRIDANVFEVLATGGDIFLGGLDFDNQLVDELLARFVKQHGQAFSGDPVALSRIAAEAERTKVALTERSQVEAVLPMLQMTADGKPLDLKTVVTRDELNALSASLVDRTIDVVKDVLLDAKLKFSDLDDIVLVGGMSRMPLVRDRLKALFGKAALANINADEAVALGAALYSGTVDKVSNVVLIDVVPMTIGIGLPGGTFKRIIQRNTPLPAASSFALNTSKDDEKHLELNLFQGEDAHVVGNEYLGTVSIDGLPKGPKGSVQVIVSVKLDAECVLHVDARELRSRVAFKATLATRYTPEQIRTRLGIAPTANATTGARAQELAQRGGRFWSFLKRVVG